ncbi:hypothetical protein [Aquirufa ecclesiirivi]|uniref:hypothetical protein n=1 Tax=Aquirufa ecclesiirivi TaxID=2715124 RepID=UPI0014075983|nr:hypothetical protein [Aquirufa ecclesiirivi]NHC48875.1 hypothetical protein [Aquirufa ecclesiirivi]
MKKVKIIVKITLLSIGCLATIFLISFLIRKLRVESDSKNISSTNFVVNYYGILESEAEDISIALELNYDRIRTELKDPKHDKISVFIYPNQSDFNKAIGIKNSNASGTSRGPLEFHLKYETWYNSIFPQKMEKVAVHEFTHCVQLNILIQDALSKSQNEKVADFDKNFETGFEKNYPQWFWEAICDYEAGIVNNLSVKYGMKNSPTLKELNNSNQIYNVGYTIVEYFVSKYGKEKLPEFIKSYGNFEKVIGVTEMQFEIEWQKFVKEKY